MVTNYTLSMIVGELVTAQRLDREHVSRYLVPIVARDGGGRAGYTSVTVNVADQGDFRPLFLLTNYKTNIYSNTSVDASIITVSDSTQPSKHEALSHCWFNVGHRRRRWSNIEPTLAECLVFAGNTCPQIQNIIEAATAFSLCKMVLLSALSNFAAICPVTRPLHNCSHVKMTSTDSHLT